MADEPATKPKEQAKMSMAADQDSSGYECTDWEISMTTDQASSGYASTDSEMSMTTDQASSGYATTDSEMSNPADQSSASQGLRGSHLFKKSKPLYRRLGFQGQLFKMSKPPYRSSASQGLGRSHLFTSKELEGVLLHTRRLTVGDRESDIPIRLSREGQKSGHDTVLRGAGLGLHVGKWMSTDDETHLELSVVTLRSLLDLIFILASLCPAVEHISIDSDWIHPHQFTPKLMPMRSVVTVCIKFRYCTETLHKALLSVKNCFPNAESLDLQVGQQCLISNQAYFREVNSSSSSLRELKLRYEGSITTDSMLMDISTSFPNILSLVFSGFGGWLLNKSGKDFTSCKMPHLTNIQLKPFGMDDCCRFDTFLNVLHIVNVTSPRLKLVEANQVQLEGAELASVKWSRTSSSCELQLEGASAAVPMADVMHLVSNELKGVTVLTFDRCMVCFPQSISHPPQSTGEESSLRELKFLNVEFPLSQSDIHKLSEMYPNVNVTVVHESQASHEDSRHGTGIPLKPESKTSLSSPPSPTSSIDNLAGATARVQVHEEQTDTQNTEEEGKEEEEEDYIAMESLLHETEPDEVNVKPIKTECCKRVGVEGGKLQLDSFGIELEIPPGAIDSETPQEISLSVLTDTPNLGNSKEEMSVCFGVQCLAPDDLVLKLPVTYTIPHCAVITRYSSVKAVLYTGEGEYSPDAEVKDKIPLTQSGIPNCNIKRDILRLQMNHFSWALIRFKLKNFFFKGKRMCCLPFAEKRLPEERTPVVLRAHLYDDITGSKEIASQEEGIGFACIHPEAEVLISVAEVDVKMTCFIDRHLIGDATVKYDKLWGGHHRTKTFKLDLRSQPDERIIVTLQVGQTGQLPEELLCIFKFTTPCRSTSFSTHSLERVQGASSLQTQQPSHRSTDETPENISGKPVDFDEKLTTVAQKVGRRDEIDNLGKALGFDPEDIQRYVDTNMKTSEVSFMGTLSMLRKWRKKQTKATECKALERALREAGQIRLADELFGTS